ncbi:hypothetical protein A1F94_000786 [Pyrenophora tritici-repentis]|nr:hypothetical protein PtrV1_01408 [Pyrenophora tritici-repentis]KAF7454147.1 hypothetical protein A1F99_014050 [Pyrenophora tritici-repentis]KAF7577236.1 Atrophin-1 multi-domain protein [Pyrenophora tritici-repentis]KAG9387894.1 hypothetical protein A1F94_000786 [Pyrenophora tritici-repentis]KAI1542604.1 PAT1 domain containing protein [Pyrenophora tritici-repentis]
MPPVRSTSGARSPEHRALPFSHSRHTSQVQPLGQAAAADVYSPAPNTSHNSHGVQQVPSRSSILTPPVKEEPRNPPTSLPSAQPQPLLHSQLQHPQRSQPTMHNTPPPAVPKPAAEPRKSNLMSLLNDTDPEEPRRKKPSEQGPPSHSSTPQQTAPIAPPPPTTQSYSLSRRPPYEDTMVVQPPFSRQSYAQQSSIPTASSSRPIDLTDDKQPPVTRPSLRDTWQAQQPFHRGMSQTPQLGSISSSQSGLPQPPVAHERSYANHRSVFGQHNTPRQNPTPPPLSGFNNSPNPHSRTPSISGPPGSLPRHAIPGTTSTQHAQALNASAQILQPNPYAQVDPPGSGGPPSGPMGMRPSPHLPASHISQQRDSSGRNDHSQTSNANLSYSNPQTPNELSGQHPFQSLNRLTEPYRPRDPRDAHDMDHRQISDRDTSRELSQRTDYLRDQLSNPVSRATGPPMHEDMRYQPQDRVYLSQRSQTPLSRPDHGQPPPLQHPPHSSLGVANHSLYSQRVPDEPSHHFMRDPQNRSISNRIREEHAQMQHHHHAAAHREEHVRRENEMREREMREREMRDHEMRDRDMRERSARDAHYRESIMRGRDMRGPPPPPGSGPGSMSDQRPPPTTPMDWVNGVRHQQERGPWQR